MDSLRAPKKERILAALYREKSDRVPNFEDIVDPLNTAYIMGRPDNLTTACRQLPPEEYVEFARRTSQDVINVVMDSSPAPTGSICTWEDIEKTEANLINPSVFRERMLGYVEAVKGTDIGICANTCAPFFRAYMMTGPVPIQDFLLKLYDDPEFTERVMEIQFQHQMRIMEAILDLPITFFIIADDTCGADGFFCSEAMMDRLWSPRARQMVELVKAKGIPVMWHCCGKLDQVIPRIVEWGVDCIEPIQTSCNDIYALKAAWGDKLCLKGNMCIEGDLAFGTPQQVAADTREHIERLAYDGGYIVDSSHSIVDAVAPENYRAMIDATIEYGAY